MGCTLNVFPIIEAATSLVRIVQFALLFVFYLFYHNLTFIVFACPQMDHLPPCYTGFADGTSRWSPNLASAAWVLYSPSNELIHLDGICIGAATNNQVEYDAVTSLLTAALHMGIRHLQVFLDSQLLVSQLNNCYQVCDPCLFRKFLRTKQLSR